jgi:transposase
LKVRLTSEEKLALLGRIEAGEGPAAVAREAGVLRKSLYEWRAAYRAHGAAGLEWPRRPKPGGRVAEGRASADGGPSAARPPDSLAKANRRIAELERLVGRQQADLDFFHEALRSWGEKRRASGAPISSRSSKR